MSEREYEAAWNDGIDRAEQVSIADFLLTQIAEDERNAGHYVDIFPDGDMAPVFRRVLAECAAKRAIVEACREDHEHGIASGDDTTELATAVLRSLATVYTVRHGYRHEWRA